MSMMATTRLGIFIEDSRNTVFAPDVVEKATCCMLDSMGLAMLARDEPNVLIMNRVLSGRRAGDAYATVWASGQRVEASDAAMANSLAVHAQFHDDTDFSSWAHPGSLIVPVAVCVGEKNGAAIKDVIGAIIVGYSVMDWLGGRDTVARALIERGIRTSPALGVVGAAATASYLLGSDKEQSANAVAIAAGVAGGVLEAVFCGSDEWRIQNAHAARSGIFAAELARHGLSAAEGALDGTKGLLKSLAGLNERPAGWMRQPEDDAILRTVAKPWATLGDNMSVVIAAKLLFDRGVDTARIREVVVKVWDKFAAYPGTSFSGPFKRVSQAVASMSFNVAAMLVYGELEYDKAVECRDDPAILGLIQRVRIVPDQQGNPYDANVTVLLDDGTSLSCDACASDDTQLRHNAQVATRLMEQRMLRAGYRPGTGASLSECAFAGTGSIADVLNKLRIGG